jgi:hypothetical protein
MRQPTVGLNPRRRFSVIEPWGLALGLGAHVMNRALRFEADLHQSDLRVMPSRHKVRPWSFHSMIGETPDANLPGV